jgi:AcrR family transcriptional regulator
MARPANPEARAAMQIAARRAFAAYGVDAARIEDIARAAGLSKASFYVYFESKDALFRELVAEFFGACQQCADDRHAAVQRLQGRVGGCDANDWARRTPRYQQFAALDHEYTLRILRILWDWRDMLKCLLEHPQGELVEELLAATISTLSGRLGEGMREGFLRQDIDPELASEVLVGAYVQLGRRMYRLDAPPDFERWALAVETVINEGLRPREGQ